MMHPTDRAIVLAAVGLPLALLPAIVRPGLWGAWFVFFLGLALALGLDAFLALPPGRLVLDVQIPKSLVVGEPGRVTVRAQAMRSAEVEFLLDLHPDFAPAPKVRVAMEPERGASVEITIVSRRRGHPTVDALWCRWSGPLGLMRRQVRRALGIEVAVVPDLAPVQAVALRFQAAPSARAGLKVERYMGDGSEFDAVREYAPGLDHRAIHWKASARHRRLLCREFRAERDHQVLLALDTGHLMAEAVSGVPRLDHAISAALLLGYASLRLHDRVGLFAFDRAARAWTDPQGGLGAFPRLRAATAQLSYTHEETNYTLGMAELSSRLRRRSLVVVFTEFADTVTAELMIENVSRLARKQLVLFVALRDPNVEEVARGAPRHSADLYRAVVASDLVRERELVLARLRRAGVHCVDAFPGNLSTRLLNRYLDIKRRELV